MVVIENGLYEEVKNKLGDDIDKVRIPASHTMFKDSLDIIIEYENAIVTENGEDVAVLGWFASAYVHDYAYTGFIDTEFIDRYEVIFLHDCNEYAVELCLTALDKWKGSILVLVGENWKYVIDGLPDIPGITCVWQDALLKDFYESVTEGKSYMHVLTALVGEEPMDRYYDNIMTYDEVMTFTYLFAQKVREGDLNPDKKFWVYDAGYGNLGIFTIFNKATSCARYAKKKGFIPVPMLVNIKGPLGIYQDYKGDDVWHKFYEQPEGYSLEEVWNSENVYYSPTFYNAAIMQRLMDQYSGDIELSWPDGKYNVAVKKYICERESRFLPYPEKTLGVLARGTDYINTHLANHSKHATKEMLCDKIDSALEDWGLDYIYLATEDASYCDFFKERYKDKIFYTDQERFAISAGELLADMHRNNSHKRDGFLLGVEYILSILLLSKCNSIIASGGCSGLGEAERMNSGKYRNRYVFNLGTN